MIRTLEEQEAFATAHRDTEFARMAANAADHRARHPDAFVPTATDDGDDGATDDGDDDPPVATPVRDTPEWDALVLAADPFAGDFGVPDDREVSDKMAIARKPGPCHICAEIIQPKERIRRMVGVIDGEIHTARFCAECCHAMAREDETGGESSAERERIGERNRAIADKAQEPTNGQ